MKKKPLNKARTCVFNANYHIVWSVKYRRVVLVDGVDQALKLILSAIADNKGFSIASMEVMPDHIHVFASAHPKISPSYIVKMLKGISGRLLFLQYPSLRAKLWRGRLWNSSFYLETIGSISEDAVKKYIENQKTRG
jgi:putative transposase